MHFVDISIIVAFLIATLYIGFRSRKKIKTFSDYAIGNRNFSDFAIYCTVAATAIGGTTIIGGAGKTYNIGGIHILAQIGLPISFVIMAIFLARRFSYYYGCYSLGDMFYKAYGITGKTVAGIIGCAYETLLVSVQFIAIATAINALTGIHYQISLLVAAIIVLIYTERGGIRAVTFTDVLQFMVLILAIPLLLIVIFGKVGGLQGLIENLPQSYLSFKQEHFNRYLFLMISLMIPTLSPHHVHRLLMTKNYKQGEKAYYNLSWIYLFVAIIGFLLGLSAKVLFSELTKGDQALFALITHYLPVGVLGIVIIGILAVLISSVDSILNTSSIMFVNDIIRPYNECIKKRELSDVENLKIARNTSIIIGIGAVIFANHCSNLFEIVILINTLWFSAILGPLYFLIFNKKISVKGLLISIIIGLIVCASWNIYLKPSTQIDGLFPGFFGNIITVFFFYLLEGKQKIFSPKELEILHQKEIACEKQQQTLKDIQLKNNSILGLCLVFLQLMPLVFDLSALTYSKLLLVLANGTMAILLIFGGSLEIFAKEKRYKWLKLTTLFVCLPINSAYLLLSSSENGLHILTLLLSFVVMLLSTDTKNKWKMVFACGLTALITAFLFQKNNCIFLWPETFAWQHSFYLFGYLAVLVLLESNLTMLKKEKQLVAYRERYTMARSLSHDLMSPLVALHMLVGNKKTIELNEKESNLLKNITKEMESYIENFILGNLKEGIPLKPENLNECLISCTEKQKILSRQKFDVQLQAKGTVFARVDSVLFRRIINNLLKICTHALPPDCKTVIISLEETPQGKAKVLLQAAQGHFSAKLIQSMFTEDQKLGDEIDLGISFREFQDIVTKWRGKLEIITHDDDAFFQMTIPFESSEPFSLHVR